MDRRDFLKEAALGSVGAASLGTAGCAGLLGAGNGSSLGTLTDSEMAERLARLDRGLESLNSAPFLETVVSPESLERSPRLRKYVAGGDALARKSFRTLLTTGLVHDLPPQARNHPDLQARIARQSAEIDETVTEVTGMLSALPERERADIQKTLRKNPDIVMKITEALDADGKALGLESPSRRKIRLAGTDISFRMRRQPPSLLIDHYVGKVERVAARRGADIALQRRVASEAMKDLFWVTAERPTGSESSGEPSRFSGPSQRFLAQNAGAEQPDAGSPAEIVPVRRASGPQPTPESEQAPADQSTEGTKDGGATPSPTANELRKICVHHYLAGRYKKALASIRQAIELDPGQADDQAFLGRIWFAIGDAPRAIDAFRTAIELNPKSAWFHIELGDVYRSQGAHWNAKKCYEAALLLEPDNQPARRRLEILEGEKPPTPTPTSGSSSPYGGAIAGGVIMGIGLVVLGISAAASGLQPGGITAGVVLLLIGLIVLVIGAIVGAIVDATD